MSLTSQAENVSGRYNLLYPPAIARYSVSILPVNRRKVRQKLPVQS